MLEIKCWSLRLCQRRMRDMLEKRYILAEWEACRKQLFAVATRARAFLPCLIHFRLAILSISGAQSATGMSSNCVASQSNCAAAFVGTLFQAKFDCSLCAMLRFTNIPRNPDRLCVCIVVFPYSSLKSGSKLLQCFDYFWTRKMLAICWSGDHSDFQA